MISAWGDRRRLPHHCGRIECLLRRVSHGIVRPAGEQTGNTATTLAKRRRNGRACGRQYLWSAICATQSKGTRGPAVGHGPHRTIYLAGQTGIDAIGKVAEGFRAQAERPWLPFQPLHSTGRCFADPSVHKLKLRLVNRVASHRGSRPCHDRSRDHYCNYQAEP
jgi:hypothetical protein